MDGIESGGFNIKGNIFRVQRERRFPVYYTVAVHIVDEITLCAVQDFDTGLLCGFPHIRKSLHVSVIRYRHCRHSPICSPLHQCFRIRQSIQCGKTRVRMQFYPLLRRCILTDEFLALRDRTRFKHHVFVIAAVGDLSAYDQMVSFRDFIHDSFVLIGTQELCNTNRAGLVRQVKTEDRTAFFRLFPAGDRDDIPFYDYPAALKRQRFHGNRCSLYGFSINRIKNRRFLC